MTHISLLSHFLSSSSLVSFSFSFLSSLSFSFFLPLSPDSSYHLLYSFSIISFLVHHQNWVRERKEEEGASQWVANVISLQEKERERERNDEQHETKIFWKNLWYVARERSWKRERKKEEKEREERRERKRRKKRKKEKSESFSGLKDWSSFKNESDCKKVRRKSSTTFFSPPIFFSLSFSLFLSFLSKKERRKLEVATGVFIIRVREEEREREREEREEEKKERMAKILVSIVCLFSHSLFLSFSSFFFLFLSFALFFFLSL